MPGIWMRRIVRAVAWSAPAVGVAFSQAGGPAVEFAAPTPYLSVADSPFQPSSDAAAAHFAQILQKAGIPTTIRLRRGIEINAGCGQLRRATARLPLSLEGEASHKGKAFSDAGL